MNDQQMSDYLEQTEWQKILVGANYQYWHHEHCRIDPLSLRDAYRLQMKLERERDCGCS